MLKYEMPKYEYPRVRLLTDEEVDSLDLDEFFDETFWEEFDNDAAAGPYGEVPDPHSSEFNLYGFPECPLEGDVETYLRCRLVQTERVKAGIESTNIPCSHCGSSMETVTRLRFHRTEMLKRIPGPGFEAYPLYKKEVFERCGNEQCPTRV